MKEVINLLGARTKLVDSPIPTINDDQVLIKVIVSGSNPKDWKAPDWANSPAKPLGEQNEMIRLGINQGDDIAGEVVEVGKDVVEFKKGDRVAAFHEMLTPGGSFAEYAVAWSHTTFHLPHETSFEEAATIPLAALTAVISLYHHLALPLPWTPATKANPRARTPLIIYGASTAVGSFAIKLARQSNVHPIVAIAGGRVEQATVSAVKSVLESQGLVANHALDTIMSEDSTAVMKGVVNPGGKVNYVLPDVPDVSPGVASLTFVSAAHLGGGEDDCRDLCAAFCRWFTRALAGGRWTGHPVMVREGGLGGVQGAMEDLRDGKASAVKYVFRVGETAGL
ncbi:quinone oxidoreductase [Aspergillus ellipticus CBS 707.79]|uniref:Quinone oxidoreductase n=1 Tax=Aspergillus ellipticus CBS 707.79 TaxID=1448320 RepID=A0A319DAZ2_9EURO|nr:quinone oxidoreductase [Aspergillus ellipticus CBS 707.79]